MIISPKKISARDKIAGLISDIKEIITRVQIISKNSTKVELIKEILKKSQNQFIFNSINYIPDFDLENNSSNLIIYDFKDEEEFNKFLELINDKKFLIPVIIICETDEQFKKANILNSSVEYVLNRELNLNCSVLERTIKNVLQWNALLEKVLRKDSVFQLISENMTDMAGIMDMEGNMVYVTPSIENITGFKPEDMLGVNLTELIHPDDMPMVRESIIDSITRNATGKTQQYRCKHADGNYYWHQGNGKPIQDAYGRFKGLIFNSHNISVEKKLTDMLKQNEILLKTIFGSLPEGISMYYQNRVIYSNDTMALLLGYKNTNEIIEKNIIEFVAKEDRVRLAQYSEARGRGEKNAPQNYEANFIKKNREKFLGEVNIRELYYDGKKVNLVIIRDITKKKLEMEEMEKARRLESLGVLAGGIAHDFNNILTAIAGNIGLGKIGLNEDSKNFAFLQDAEKAIFRARDLTQQMLTFSKGGLPIKENCSIKEFIQESVNFVCHGSTISCDFNINDDLWAVVADKGQLNQVFNNLIINSQEAMPHGGKVEVKADNIIVFLNEHLPLAPGKYVKIVIKDQGIGIPKKILSKIFDPYFTTKQRGSGLGLASVYNIIKNHEGWIDVDSIPEIGTTFTIYLPAAEQYMEEIPTVVSLEHNQNRQQRVLVMDDEEMILNVTSNILKHLDYIVETATDGNQAIEIYKKALAEDKPFSIVILDLTIPGGMGGAETIKKLKEINPQVKAVVSSGYSNDPIMSNYRDYGFEAILTKPYQIENLSETLKILSVAAELEKKDK